MTLKWCAYCRKNDHDDRECWSTRAVTSHPASSVIMGESFKWPPLPPSPVSEGLREALAKVGLRLDRR